MEGGKSLVDTQSSLLTLHTLPHFLLSEYVAILRRFIETRSSYQYP